MIDRRAILTGSAGAAMLGLPGAATAATPDGLHNAREFGVMPGAARDQSRELQNAIDSTARHGGYLFLPPGLYVVANLSLKAPLHLSGVPGLTRLIFAGHGNLLTVSNAHNVTLSGIVFDGAGQSIAGGGSAGLLSFDNVENLVVEHCEVRNSAANGMILARCSGRIVHNTIAHAGDAAIHSNDSNGLTISYNHVHDMADNGIMIWQSEPREDGSIVTHNRIERIANRSGGSGQYGNGINIFRAGNVTASNNRISDCSYSAVRNNAGSNVQILANNCSRMGEVALYSEFAFEGAVISDNLVDGAGIGISITNFNDGGRLAVCANNLVRRLHQNPPRQNEGIGIAVEADTVVTGNVIEDAPEAGLALGWGWAARNIAATGNVMRNCRVGIMASVSKDAQSSLIANNVISRSEKAAILGMDHLKPATTDLALPGADIPATLTVTGNLVS